MRISVWVVEGCDAHLVKDAEAHSAAGVCGSQRATLSGCAKTALFASFNRRSSRRGMLSACLPLRLPRIGNKFAGRAMNQQHEARCRGGRRCMCVGGGRGGAQIFG